jgi:hypothetical protein
MLASKSGPDSPDFDTFDCLRCNATISVAPLRTTPEATRPALNRESKWSPDDLDQ